MRTRAYSAHGTKVFSNTVGSTLVSSVAIRYQQWVAVKATRACETIFAVKHPHKVIAGPVCERI
jgi:hypothetical protein